MMNNLIRRRRIRVLYYVIINFTAICLFFTLAEGITRLIISKDDKLQQILKVLEQDAVLFWRQKPYLNTQFQGVRVKTNFLGLRDLRGSFKKPGDTFRIICMGASPTFGWAVKHEHTYPYQLEIMLNNAQVPGRVYEVINAGVVGYSSHQGLIFLKNKILKFHPDVIIVSYLVNDIDTHRFYRSNGRPDKELKPRSSFAVYLENVLQNSKFIGFIRNITLRARGRRDIFSGIRGSILPGNIRVSEQDYGNNLNDIIDLARGNGIGVVLIKMALDLGQSDQLSEKQKLKASEYLSRGLDFFTSGNIDKAIEQFKTAAIHNPQSSEAFFYLGVCCEKKKDFALAREYFQKAKDMQAFRCGKYSKIYNHIIQEISEQKKVALVDVVAAFAENKDKQLFTTPIHPNAAGHNIIATKIYTTLLKYDFLSQPKISSQRYNEG